MGKRPWSTTLGIAAVLIWTAVIGFPILTYHATSISLRFGDHLHAAILFVVSQVLIFWLAARAAPSLPKRSSPPGRPIPSRLLPEQIWDAELVENALPSSAMQDSTAHSAVPSGSLPLLTVTNYCASSQVRLVLVEPSGMRYNVFPGQDLLFLCGNGAGPLRFKVVESDAATQVFMEGEGVTSVVIRQVGRRDMSGIRT